MTPSLSAPDVQASVPATQVSLSRVGVTGVEKVIRVKADGSENLYHANFECFVDLEPRQAGVHMSRFEENVGEAIDAVQASLGDPPLAPLPDTLLPPAKLRDYLGPTALRTALELDVAIIHAQRADRAGNVQMWGITGVQKEAVLAAKRAIVTVEEVVHRAPARCVSESAVNENNRWFGHENFLPVIGD